MNCASNCSENCGSPNLVCCLGVCDGSDRSDPHTSATGADAAWDDPEVTPRSTFPIGSELYPLDPGNLKGEVPEFEGGRMVEEEVFQEASGDPIQKLARTQRKRRSLEASPSRSQPGPKTAGPGKQIPRTRHASGEAWPSQVRGWGRVGLGRTEGWRYTKGEHEHGAGGTLKEVGGQERGSTVRETNE
ncbi:hypothetical protein NDU88_001527 [Pleurodeles waltl]|uniref:Uncharacterized protein n=1 Tax=Pleurodeles waltl TaxID=8319 RepID=A0AAV7WM03_PLEWA|nr:hypothetical protein NDU88_001527 [Pleurodeles waltl]